MKRCLFVVLFLCATALAADTQEQPRTNSAHELENFSKPALAKLAAALIEKITEIEQENAKLASRVDALTADQQEKQCGCASVRCGGSAPGPRHGKTSEKLSKNAELACSSNTLTAGQKAQAKTPVKDQLTNCSTPASAASNTALLRKISELESQNAKLASHIVVLVRELELNREVEKRIAAIPDVPEMKRARSYPQTKTTKPPYIEDEADVDSPVAISHKLSHVAADYSGQRQPHRPHVRFNTKLKNLTSKTVISVRYETVFKDSLEKVVYKSNFTHNGVMGPGDTLSGQYYWEDYEDDELTDDDLYEKSSDELYHKLADDVMTGKARAEIHILNVTYAGGKLVKVGD